MVEGDRKLEHQVSKNKGHLDDLRVCSSTVSVIRRSTVALCSQKRHQSTAEVRHQPIVASAPSSEPSRVTPHDIPAGSLWPTSLTLPSKMGHLWLLLWLLVTVLFI